MADEQERTFTQEEVNKLVGEARREGRESMTGEIESLKSEIESKDAKINSTKKQFDIASQTLGKILDKRLEGFGDNIKEALEALPLDTLGKIDWLESHGDIFQESDENHGTPTPSPKGTKSKAKPKPHRTVKL